MSDQERYTHPTNVHDVPGFDAQLDAEIAAAERQAQAEKDYRRAVLREDVGDPWQEETDRMDTFYGGVER